MIQKSLWTYFIECYTKHYVNFSGRARRREFWGFQLYYFLIALIPLTIFSYYFLKLLFNLIVHRPSSLDFFSFSTLDRVFFGLSFLFILIYGLGSLLPLYAVLVRRFHDRGLSGKWILALFILSQTMNYLNMAIESNLIKGLISALFFGYALWVLAQCIMDSQPGDNKYGSNPKELSNDITYPQYSTTYEVDQN